MKTNTISAEITWEMIRHSWELIKVNYRLCLALVVIVLAAAFLGSIPFVGFLFGAALSAVLPLLFLPAMRLWEGGQPGDLKQRLAIKDDKKTLSRLLPLLIVQFALNAIPNGLAAFSFLGPTISSSLSMLSLPFSLLIGLAIPILLFNSDQDAAGSVQWALKGLLKNIFPFIVGALLLGVLALVSVLFFVVPFFFITLPIIMGYNYLWYRVVHEDLVIEVRKEDLL
ncbi:MAG: hypothetical protein AAF203_09495 [Pseudomonadota bacterium]